MTSRGAARALERAIVLAIAALEHDDNPLQRARIAHLLSERMRLGSEQFADQRSAAFGQLRDEGWSLADLKGEFGIARARLSQLNNRGDYRAAP